MLFIKHILSLGLALTLVVWSTSSTSTPVYVNDVREVEAGVYNVAGSDPFFVIKTSDLNAELHPADGGLLLPFAVSQSPSEWSFELFYAPLDAQNIAGFDPQYRAIYASDSQQANRALYIEQPTNKEWLASDHVRIDFDNCHACQIRFGESKEKTDLIKISHLYSGAKQLPSTGRQLPFNDWIANDLTLTDGIVRTIGDDPFLVTENLDVLPSSVAGLSLEWTYEPSKGKNKPDLSSDLVEVFHADDQHSFHPKSASVFKLIAQSIEPHKPIQVFIPLSHINTERPNVGMITQLRLDLPQVKNGNWRLMRASLVSPDQANEYEQYQPKLLHHAKSSRSTAKVRTLEIVQKLVQDWVFLTIYLALIFTVVYQVWRKIRKHA